MRVTKTGKRPINGREVSWAFPGDQTVRDAWLVDVTQDGATVTAGHPRHNRVLSPRERHTFGFLGTTGGLAAPAPELFRRNGSPCTTT